MSELPSLGPLLEPDAEPPGAFVQGKDAPFKTWRGESNWRTRHGLAIAQWTFGRPVYAWEVLAHDGARHVVQSRWPASDTFRFILDGAIVHGVLDVGHDDIVFTPLADQPMPTIDQEDRALFDVLATDSAFMSDMQEPTIARALYGVIENNIFFFSAQRFDFGQRGAGHFVAALRANGEDYLDYAWGQGGPWTEQDTQMVRSHFARLGIAEALPE